MAVSLNTRKASGRGISGWRRSSAMSEINVTPMVDVMLVLLIIFMVTAPLLTVGVPVDLPKTKAAVLNEQTEPLVVSVDAEGRIYLQEDEVSIDDLPARLGAVSGNNPDIRIFMRADRTLDYGRVMEVMGRISSAGFARVALVAEMKRPPSMPARR